MIIQGDCIEVMRGMESNSVDTVITDPPYHLTSITKRFGKKGSAPAKYGTDGAFQRASKGFMGKEWDGGDIAFKTDVWEECLRVAKPGATLLCFGGSRTYHRMTCAVEDAGWVIKDCIMWLYGSGFPKALDLKKSMDKKGLEEAKQWSGWKSHGLKPAYEPILVAMKPNDGTYVNNALKWGVSGLNIDKCRIGADTITIKRQENYKECYKGYIGNSTDIRFQGKDVKSKGRFPANIILDEEAGKMLDEQSGSLKKKVGLPYTYKDNKYNVDGFIPEIRPNAPSNYNDQGGASRFFYCAKASKSEKNAGCGDLPKKQKIFNGQSDKSSTDIKDVEKRFTTQPVSNNHPCVKPLKLMEYLCRLTKTPTGGIVLDCFMGSGSTGIAAIRTGREFIGIEMDKDYCEIAEARIKNEED